MMMIGKDQLCDNPAVAISCQAIAKLKPGYRYINHSVRAERNERFLQVFPTISSRLP